MRSNPWYLMMRKRFLPVYWKTGSIFRSKYVRSKQIKKTKWETTYQCGNNTYVIHSRFINDILLKKGIMSKFPSRYERKKRPHGKKVLGYLSHKALHAIWRSQDEAIKRMNEKKKKS